MPTVGGGSTTGRGTVILSTKSAGSSAFQAAIVEVTGARTIGWTPHHEQETLYFWKGVHALGASPPPLVASGVRYTPAAARDALAELLTRNGVPVADLDLGTRDGVVRGWGLLRRAIGDDVVEKSPHHAADAGALDLLVDAIRADQGCEYRVIGLSRHPQATAASAWRRFRHPPRAVLDDWARSWRNILDLQVQLGEQLLVVRYEDLLAGRAGALVPAFGAAAADAIAARMTAQRPAAGDRVPWGSVPAAATVAAELGYPLGVEPRRWSWQVEQAARVAARRARTRVARAVHRP